VAKYFCEIKKSLKSQKLFKSEVNMAPIGPNWKLLAVHLNWLASTALVLAKKRRQQKKWWVHPLSSKRESEGAYQTCGSVQVLSLTALLASTPHW
jgi:hypothetical protein